MRKVYTKNLIEIILIILIAILLIVGIIGIIMEKKNTNDNKAKIVKINVENYVAYIKINPSIKLDYSYTCTIYSDGTEECNNPKVKNYELINDDAKKIFKDIYLLQNSSNLINVIELICRKTEESGISFNNINIQSDWNRLNDYLKEKKQAKYTITVNYKEKNQLIDIIDTDIKAEKLSINDFT